MLIAVELLEQSIWANRLFKSRENIPVCDQCSKLR